MIAVNYNTLIIIMWRHSRQRMVFPTFSLSNMSWRKRIIRKLRTRCQRQEEIRRSRGQHYASPAATTMNLLHQLHFR